MSRRRTKWLVALLVAAALVGSLIALAPTILSQGLAARWLAGVIQKHVEGSVTIEQLRLSWADGQRVKGLKINDALGHEVADLDLRLASGLAALLLGPALEQQVDVGGRLLVDLDQGGSWSLLRAAQDASPADSALALPKLPLELRLDSLDLHVRDARRGGDMSFEDLHGSVRTGRAQPLEVDLNAVVKGLMGSGSFQLSGSVEDLIDELGRLQPERATGKLTLTGQSLAWLFEGEAGVISELRIDASSHGLSEQLDVTLAASGAIEDQPCRLDGTLLVAQPVTAGGAIVIDPSRITGQLHAQRLPLILLEPWLGHTTLDLIHAFGDGFDVDADLVGETDRRLTMTARNERTALNLQATITQEGIDGHQARLEWSVPPALTTSLGGPIESQTLTVISDWSSFTVPWSPGRGPQLEGLAATGTIELSGSVASDKDASSASSTLALELESSALRDGLRYRGTMAVEGGSLKIDEGRIDLIDDHGALCFRAGEVSAQLEVTPDLWKRLGADAIGIVLAHGASATIALQPFSVSRAEGGAWRFNSLAFTAAVKGAEFGDPQEPTRVVKLTGLALQGAIDLESQAGLQISGDGTVVFASAAETPGRCHFDLRAPDLKGVPTGTVRLEQVAVNAIELLFAQSPGTWERWLGASASLTMTSPPHPGGAWLAEATTDRLTTRLQVHREGDHLECRSEEFSLTITPDTVNALLPSAGALSHVRLDEAVSVQATSARFDVPMKASKDGAAVVLAIDANMTAPTLLLHVGEKRVSLSDLQLELNSKSPSEIAYSLSATTAAGDVSDGSFSARGTLSGGLASPDLDVDVQLKTFPVVALDALGSFNGYLETALGAMATGSISGENLLTNAWTSRTAVTTPQGQVAGLVAMSLEEMVTPAGEAVTCELQLTEPLCKDVLANIHPVLGDIRSAAQPLKATITNARVPLDGDLRKLNGDLRIQIGEVAFAAQSGILAPLDLVHSILVAPIFGGGENRTVPGSVPPITVNVRDGVITYQSFEITVGSNKLEYAGTINLVERTVDISTMVPVSALGGMLRGIPFIPDGVLVPVRTTGHFGSLKTEVELLRVPSGLLRGLTGG